MNFVIPPSISIPVKTLINFPRPITYATFIFFSGTGTFSKTINFSYTITITIIVLFRTRSWTGR